VYKARDTRLARVVALKLLPPEVAQRPDRRARFETEARAISSLSHPHICTLFDVGEQDGRPFLVMEHLDGETLDDRIGGGALPPNAVLRYAVEIADALDHAHREGIIHRDLKPSNVMLTASGVKLLDFGLARGPVLEEAAVGSTMSFEHRRLTTEGTMIGTFQYMAPEQLEGRDADTRADIFAFGAVVYEMATGRKAFEAHSQAGRIGAILHTDPPSMASLAPTIPAALDRAVGRCLTKDPDHRWQTARDLKRELEWIAEGAMQPNPFEATHARPRERLAWIAALILAISSVSLAVWHFREPPIARRAVRLSVLPPLPTGDFSLSPDGRLLAFVARGQSGFRLWIQPLDSLTPHLLDGTEDVEFPFWSPDSRFIAFGAGGKLKKIAVSGGPVHTLCDARTVIGGAWNRDDVIVFAPNNRTPLYRVSAAGGEPTPVTTLDVSQGQNTHRFPYFLPGGRRFLYLARSSSPERSGIYVGSLDSTGTTRIMSVDSMPAYAAPGYLLFARGRALLAQPFDVDALRLAGDPVQVLDDIRYSRADSYASFSLSEHGELAYQLSAAVPRSELAWFTRAGQRLELPGASGNLLDPALDRDGRRVAVMRWENASSDIWVVDTARGSSSRLTRDPSVDYAPLWSPDGRSIVFASSRDGPSDLYQTASGGGTTEGALFTSSAVKHATDWSLDGRLIIYESRDRRTDWDLWTLPVHGGGKAEPFLQTEFAERLGRLAPNRRWMAYVSNESGRDEVYVRPFPASSGKWMISTAGGTEPRWRRDGEELFYLSADQKLIAVPVKTHSRFDQGLPQVLFDMRMIDDRTWGYDVTPDGQRFVVSLAVGDSTPAPINIALDWTAALPK
jgi:serine/threonine protein kinase